MDEPSSEQQQLVEDNLLEECLIKETLDSNLSKPLDNVESSASTSEVPPPSLQEDNIAAMEVDSQLEEPALNSFADSQKELDLEKFSEIHDENELVGIPIEKDSDLPPMAKNDEKIINDPEQTKSLFQDNIESKLTETAPLLLLETKAKSLDEDSVFSTDLSTMPDQLLAEPPRSEELDERTEQDIASNIEEQLREFEGSEDEMSLPKDLDLDTHPSQTPIAQMTRPEDIFGDDFNSDSGTNRGTPMAEDNIEQKDAEILEDIEKAISVPEESQENLEDVKKEEEIPSVEEQVSLNTSEVTPEAEKPPEILEGETSEILERETSEILERETSEILEPAATLERETLDILEPPETLERETLDILEPPETLESETMEILETPETLEREAREILDYPTTKPTEEAITEKLEKSVPESEDMESLLLEEEQEQSEAVNFVEDTAKKPTNDSSQDNEDSEIRNIDFEDVEMQSIIDSKNTSTNEGADDPFDKIEHTAEASTSRDPETHVTESADGDLEKESLDSTEEPFKNIDIQLSDEKLPADKVIALEEASIEDKLDAIFNEGSDDKSSAEAAIDETKELELEEIDEAGKDNVTTEEDKIDNIADLLESEKETQQEKEDSNAELLEPMDVDQTGDVLSSKEELNQAEEEKPKDDNQKESEEDHLKEMSEKDEISPEGTSQEMPVEEEQEAQRETPAEEIEKDDSTKEDDVPMEDVSENIESVAESAETTKQQEEALVEETKDEETASNSTQEKKKRAKEKTVRDVKESEESDVCLLPDSEKVLTGAEKEKAILARENAEKEAEKIEKEKTKRHSTRHSTPEETAVEEDAPEPQIDEGRDLNENEIKELSTDIKDDRCFKCRKIKSCKYKLLRDQEVKYLCDLKCVHSFRATSKDVFTLTARKIVISSIFGFMSSCVRCRAKRSCCFRFKSTETGSYNYLCSTTCMNSFIGKNIEKYIVRRKKYIVEEMAQETPETCIHCKESKGCRYQFKQDDDTLYICNEDCFNLLSKEEPERYRLKRRSVRVRELGSHPTASHSEAENKIVARSQEEADAARIERESSFIRHCAHCYATIEINDAILQWETADFCNEQCLGKYQNVIGSKCHMCKSQVPLQSLGKYCVRFGFEIRQFCCTSCLDRFKKGLKVCSYCQKDISKDKEGFLAPVGDKGQFKDFCSQGCMSRYDEICNPKKKANNGICAVCSNDKPIRVEISLDNRDHTFCSNPCFSAFKFVNNLFPDQCGMCLKYFERKSVESYTLYNEKNPKVFCCKICMNIFIALTRKIVACQWCKVKKYNFDMIQKQCGAQTLMLCSVNCLTLYGVSLNAVSMRQQNCDQCKRQACPQYHLTMSDTSLRNFCTYQCVMLFQNQFGRLAWPLSNSGVKDSASKKNAPFPTGVPKRVKIKAVQAVEKEPEKTASLPVICNVESLADTNNTSGVGVKRILRKNRSRQTATTSQPESVQTDVTAPAEEPKAASSELPTSKSSDDKASQAKEINFNLTPVVAVKKLPLNTASIHTQTKAPAKRSFGVNTADADTKTTKRSFGVNTVETEPPAKSSPKPLTRQDKSEKLKTEFKTCMISVAPPPPKVANKQTMCKPASISKGNSCRPHPCSVECQTDEEVGRKILIPIPVPIYVPQPMYMYSAPFPVPIPIPLPIPVPIFIPTTRNSAEGIMKEIKKIQEKTPTDPFEAELLMMAEMVAEEKKNESDSDSELGTAQQKRDKSPTKVEVYPTETIEQSNSFGEDVLQMALKMATECEEPTVDLESAMTTTTISTPEQQPQQQQQHIPVVEDAIVEDSSEMHHQMIMIDGQRQIIRGRKRAISPASTSPSQTTQLPIQAPTQRNNRVQPVPPPIKRPRRSDVHVIAQQEPILKEVVEKPDANMCLKYTFGVNAWKQWVMTKNSDLEKSTFKRKPFKSELLQLTADELNYSLCLFVKEVRKPNGSEYAPDTIYYLVLGIQQYLYENGRIDNIFTDPYYERFTECLDEVAKKFSILYNDSQYIVTRVEEEHLWECKQLGAHSPHVLLSTLMFFNTKHFNLTTVEEHMQLSFSHIMKHWKRSPTGSKTPGQRNVLLRFYPPQSGPDANPRKKKVYEQQENEENPLRCPVKLYEFYLSKCPESVKTRNDVFYLQPERSCVPDSPVWYSTQALSREALSKMLHRVKMVKEINIALLTS